MSPVSSTSLRLHVHGPISYVLTHTLECESKQSKGWHGATRDALRPVPSDRPTVPPRVVQDVLILNLTSSVPGRAKLVLWTYNGCSGPPNPTAARNTTDALPTQAQQIGSTLHVARANGWEYQLQAYEDALLR